ncbi:hypothetical protein ACJBSJ_10795, partial [Streptococcus suis]
IVAKNQEGVSETASQPTTPATTGTGETNTPKPTEIQPDWTSTSAITGTVAIKEEGGVRYNALSSTTQNNTGESIAIFEKAGLEGSPEG